MSREIRYRQALLVFVLHRSNLKYKTSRFQTSSQFVWWRQTFLG